MFCARTYFSRMYIITRLRHNISTYIDYSISLSPEILSTTYSIYVYYFVCMIISRAHDIKSRAHNLWSYRYIHVLSLSCTCYSLSNTSVMHIRRRIEIIEECFQLDFGWTKIVKLTFSVHIWYNNLNPIWKEFYQYTRKQEWVSGKV